MKRALFLLVLLLPIAVAAFDEAQVQMELESLLEKAETDAQLNSLIYIIDNRYKEEFIDFQPAQNVLGEANRRLGLAEQDTTDDSTAAETDTSLVDTTIAQPDSSQVDFNAVSDTLNVSKDRDGKSGLGKNWWYALIMIPMLGAFAARKKLKKASRKLRRGADKDIIALEECFDRLEKLTTKKRKELSDIKEAVQVGKVKGTEVKGSERAEKLHVALNENKHINKEIDNILNQAKDAIKKKEMELAKEEPILHEAARSQPSLQGEFSKTAEGVAQLDQMNKQLTALVKEENTNFDPAIHLTVPFMRGSEPNDEDFEKMDFNWRWFDRMVFTQQSKVQEMKQFYRTNDLGSHLIELKERYITLDDAKIQMQEKEETFRKVKAIVERIKSTSHADDANKLFKEMVKEANEAKMDGIQAASFIRWLNSESVLLNHKFTIRVEDHDEEVSVQHVDTHDVHLRLVKLNGELVRENEYIRVHADRFSADLFTALQRKQHESLPHNAKGIQRMMPNEWKELIKRLDKKEIEKHFKKKGSEGGFEGAMRYINEQSTKLLMFIEKFQRENNEVRHQPVIQAMTDQRKTLIQQVEKYVQDTYGYSKKEVKKEIKI
ncbi:MAG: hypothetical protein ABIH34_01545 [Nanoarchaeota archaeon]